MVDEFTLIQRYFAAAAVGADTTLGIGDDCALLAVPPGQQLAVTTDTLVESVHFFPSVAPEDLGYKALAVSLSDLAAMGADPRWALLALTMPWADADWLNAFSQGFFTVARQFGVALVGGDTTRGPLTITVQALGLVPAELALTRGGARPGDSIFVSGQIGSAGLALAQLRTAPTDGDPVLLRRLHRPVPRIAVGLALRGVATACIDISDGLAADLNHVLAASGCGALLEWDALPMHAAVQQYIADTGDWQLPLRAGDDYELCFTVPPAAAQQINRLSNYTGVALTRIGTIEPRPALRIRKEQQEIPLSTLGYRHFD